MEMTLRQHIDAYDPPPTAETDEMLRRLSSRLNAWERVHATNNYHLVRTVYADFRPPSPEPWAMLHHKVPKSVWDYRNRVWYHQLSKLAAHFR